MCFPFCISLSNGSKKSKFTMGLCTCKRDRPNKKQQPKKRLSVRFVPATKDLAQRSQSMLGTLLARYVASSERDNSLEAFFENLSLSPGELESLLFDTGPLPISARDVVLRRCGQTEPVLFEHCYPSPTLKNCHKIGEGVYGEVFLFRNLEGGTSVMKVIPIEGEQLVNGERQKKFEEIISEIVIAEELSNLRTYKKSSSSSFCELRKVSCVQGKYPARLLDLWELYDEDSGSENDSPEIFGDQQLYIVLELANGGKDLEAFVFNNALQAFSVFKQTVCALAVAESALEFEHRDMHWGNILVTKVDNKKKVSYNLDGKVIEVPTGGAEVSIIDFTLSRITFDEVCIYNDLGLDPDLFTADGDYQFEIYKLMQKHNGNEWQHFEPYTNILWMHYTLDKMITGLRYKSAASKIHKEHIKKLKDLHEEVLNYKSVQDFVKNKYLT